MRWSDSAVVKWLFVAVLLKKIVLGGRKENFLPGLKVSSGKFDWRWDRREEKEVDEGCIKRL